MLIDITNDRLPELRLTVPDQDVVAVPLDALRASDSPRLSGTNAAHVELLAGLDEPLPPIVVHRQSMRVIDGAHRLGAARLRQQCTIAVQFFDGDEQDAFVLAVRANVGHGLPLTLADREAAALRILAARPYGSDRSIAAITGLNSKTVGALRQRAGVDGAQTSVRIGGDGRIRPVNGAEGRRLAAKVVARDPHASLRTIAKQAGVSVGTARDVRERVRRGDDPVLPGQAIPAGQRRSAATSRSTAVVQSVPVAATERDAPPRPDVPALMQSLAKDPSLRFTDSGRALLRWLFTRADGLEMWEELIAGIPPHSAYLLAELAAGCAEEWSAFASHLRQRVQSA